MFKLSIKKGFIFDNNNKTAVLLLHGLTGSPFEMHQYGKALNQRGFDVYCPVLPGHCEGAENLKKYIWQDWLGFVLAEFDSLCERYENVFVSGLCLGGVLALAVALERKNLSGVIGLSATLFLDGWETPWYKFLLPIGMYTFVKDLYRFKEPPSCGIKNEIVSRKIKRMQDNNDGSGAFNFYPMHCIAELVKCSKFVRKNVKKIECPTLLIHSKEDNLTKIQSSQFVYDNISSSWKKLVTLENSYHVITLDNDKKTVVEETCNFVNLFTGARVIEKELVAVGV